jgi:hypothetical protein
LLLLLYSPLALLLYHHNKERIYFSYLWAYDLYDPVRNAFDAGKSITRASGRGLGPSSYLLLLLYSPLTLLFTTTTKKVFILAIYGPMIYTAPYVMLFMRANPLQGQVGGGRALEIETFLGPV